VSGEEWNKNMINRTNLLVPFMRYT
jgi:hypothetical protein